MSLPPHSTLLAITDVAFALGRQRRATLDADGTPETVTTHTVMLGLVAAVTAHRHNQSQEARQGAAKPLNVGLVVEYALVHDLVEALVGDTDTAVGLNAAAAAEKAAREHRALVELRETFRGHAPWILRRIDQYEAQRVTEARFVRFLDKLLPKLTHVRNNGMTFQKKGRPVAVMRRAHEAQVDQLRAQYPEFSYVIEEELEDAEAIEAAEAGVIVDLLTGLVEAMHYAEDAYHVASPQPDNPHVGVLPKNAKDTPPEAYLEDYEGVEHTCKAPMRRTVWGHTNGGLYRVLAVATREHDREPVVIYARVASGTTERDTRIWTRPVREFLDGRFVLVSRPAGPPPRITEIFDNFYANPRSR